MRSRRLPSTILHRFLPPLACAAASAAAAAAAAAQAQAVAEATAAGGPGEAAQVLVIGGTDPYLPAFVAIDGAMRSAVAERHQRSVVWMHESIDTARFGGASGPALAELLARKFERVRIDAVVLVTEAAVDFHLRYRQQLWPATPAVFHSVAPAYARQLPHGHGLSGIQAEVDFAGALRNAMALQPQAKRVLGSAASLRSTRCNWPAHARRWPSSKAGCPSSTWWAGRRARRRRGWPARPPPPSCCTPACSATPKGKCLCRAPCFGRWTRPAARRSTACSNRRWATG
jgi:hypothetical protein